MAILVRPPSKSFPATDEQAMPKRGGRNECHGGFRDWPTCADDNSIRCIGRQLITRLTPLRPRHRVSGPLFNWLAVL
ncbi:MAG: hypothetical protein ACOC0P_03705 [Planctomycetota bacterium]